MSLSYGVNRRINHRVTKVELKRSTGKIQFSERAHRLIRSMTMCRRLRLGSLFTVKMYRIIIDVGSDTLNKEN